jgi:DNA-binding IclR family transcriptional regulator
MTRHPADEASSSGAERRTRVSAMDRVLQILDYLYETDSPASPYAVAKAVGAPMSTIYTLIEDLLEKGLLSRASDKTVWLGPRLHYYGLAYARQIDFYAAANRQMHELSRALNETVQLCGREGDHMVVLAAAEGPGYFRITSQVGTRVPLNWTASGRLLVGHLPLKERIALFERCARASPTGTAPTDARSLAAESAQALSDRLSIQVGQSDFSVACIASPICDASGNCLATISIVLPEQKLSEARHHYVDAVRNAAAAVENSIGVRSSTATMASISTVMLPGNDAIPSDERA